MTKKSTTQGRRYRILGTIGRGGFGTVYKAEHLGEGGFSKVVALKVLNPEAALVDEVATRLRDEARILGLVRHRAIVQVDGLVQLDGRWTIIMECLDGVDLREVISAGRVPRGPALEITEEIAGALHQAYTQTGPEGAPLCLLHRDIKPSNVQLTAAGEVKVLDFGTARANFAAREAQTRELAFGTIDYMSPERLEFEDSPAGDIYAVGAVLYEMLEGHSVGRASPNPNRHDKTLARVLSRMEDAGVDEDVRALVLQCLAYDPRERPKAEELGRACRKLRSSGQDLWLADWARTAIPPLEAKRGPPKQDKMTGAILIEQSGARPRTVDQPMTEWVKLDPEDEEPAVAPVPEPEHYPEPPPPPPGIHSVEPATGRLAKPPAPAHVEPEAHAPLWPLVAIAVLLGLGGIAILSIAAALWARSPEREAEPEPEPVLVEPVPEVPEPEPEIAEPELPEPEIAEPEPEPEPEPTPKPRPAVSRGTVKVEGDAQKVMLIDAGGKRLNPGRVPVGRYTVEATFEGRGAITAGEIEVASGRTVTLRCARAFGRCDVR